MITEDELLNLLLGYPQVHWTKPTGTVNSYYCIPITSIATLVEEINARCKFNTTP